MNCSSLYIHIPFCHRKCLFCSFSIAVGQEHRREEYVHALIHEMKNHQGKMLQTIYLGGGTPSMLDEKQIELLMQALRKNFLLNSTIEISMEANPEDIIFSKAKFLKDIGFNRISLGVQSLHDQHLKFLGRGHDAAKAKEAYQILREAGFNNINLDLMYGFPGQSDEDLIEDVRLIALMNSEHLSLYTLTIEPHSRFFATQLKLDDDDKLAHHYVMIAQLLEEYDFKQYEISNFSKNGFESIHNKNYWQGVPYIALGMGAHGFDGHRRYWNTPRLQEYIQQSQQAKSVLEGHEDLSSEQLIMEKVLFGLRMNEGISWDLIPVDRQALIETWIKDGFLIRENQTIRTTKRGRLILDELSVRLI